MRKTVFSALCLFLLLCGVCRAAEPVRVLCLRGPTGMSLAKLMEDTEQGRAENACVFRVVSAPEEIVAAIARGDADIAAMPTNMAAVLWNRLKGDLCLLSVNTLGALSILEKGGAVHTIADLRGRTLLAAGRGAAPEFALNYLLRQNGLEPDRDCHIEWLSEHAEVLSRLAMGKGDACLLPYPFAAAAMARVEGLREALSLAEEWRKVGGSSRLVMGVYAARRSYVESHRAEAVAFMREAGTSGEYVGTHPKEAAELIVKHGIFSNAPLVERAIPHCGLTALAGQAMREAVKGYLKVLFEAEPRSVGGALPDDAFYFMENAR
ncbi:MAG: PhnD/SsuA/transferrin family substrate-binding protein [Fretibacterium sp.]|nr:PhnD/SsuA/transferrin family substrate-binding protein [Fretibacterium sp.]